MVVAKLKDPPCGCVRPNCRYLAPPASDVRGLCRQHLAWCPDDHDPRKPWVVRTMLDQREFRTGG
jgi:hypothetical protein